MEPVAELLSRLTAPFGVFGIVGNHDDERHMPVALQRRGIAMLMDERTRLVIRGAPLELAGLKFWTKRLEEIEAVVRGATAPVLLLAHDPRRIVEAAALGVGVVPGGTHPWWPGCAAGSRGDCGKEVSGGSRPAAAEGDRDVRQSGRRDGLPPGTRQLSARGGGADPATTRIRTDSDEGTDTGNQDIGEVGAPRREVELASFEGAKQADREPSRIEHRRRARTLGSASLSIPASGAASSAMVRMSRSANRGGDQ